jgi:hypothetical protein
MLFLFISCEKIQLEKVGVLTGLTSKPKTLNLIFYKDHWYLVKNNVYTRKRIYNPIKVEKTRIDRVWIQV